MTTSWVVSDHHFSHANILKFTNYDGSPVRTFSSVEEMDETMVLNHNKLVMPEDKVYFLGDFAFSKKVLDKFAPRLNGKKKLILGNHDKCAAKDYLAHFYDIAAYKTFKQGNKSIIMSHIPIASESFARWNFNLHGHLHGNLVKDEKSKIDKRYVNVCVEHTNFTPLNLEEFIDSL